MITVIKKIKQGDVTENECGGVLKAVLSEGWRLSRDLSNGEERAKWGSRGRESLAKKRGNLWPLRWKWVWGAQGTLRVWVGAQSKWAKAENSRLFRLERVDGTGQIAQDTDTVTVGSLAFTPGERKALEDFGWEWISGVCTCKKLILAAVWKIDYWRQAWKQGDQPRGHRTVQARRSGGLDQGGSSALGHPVGGSLSWEGLCWRGPLEGALGDNNWIGYTLEYSLLPPHSFTTIGKSFPNCSFLIANHTFLSLTFPKAGSLHLRGLIYFPVSLAPHLRMGWALASHGIQLQSTVSVLVTTSGNPQFGWHA